MILRRLIPRQLNALARICCEKLDPFFNFSYSQDGEDMVLRRIFERQTNGVYVDVGAHHPFRFSNTCYFHRKGWSGVNIDPNPDAIDAFRRARRADVNLCVGVSDVPGDLLFHFFNEPALNTFDAALAAERSQISGYRLVETRQIPVRRLDALLGEHLSAEQRIDFLSVDVEGLDLAVLRSNNWVRFRPTILLVEAHERTVAGAQGDPINEFIAAQGYEMIAKTLNTLIYEDRSAPLRSGVLT